MSLPRKTGSAVVHWLAAWALLLSVLLVAREANAAGVAATVRVDSTEVVVGDTVSITFSVENRGRGRVQRPQLPNEIGGGLVRLPMCGQSFESGTAGIVSSSTCAYRASKAGAFEVGFSIDDEGQTVKANPVIIRVVDPSAVEGEAVEGGPSGDDESTTRRPTHAKSEVFLWATIDKRTAYIGEQLTYNLDIYLARQVNVANERLPTFKDFLTVKLDPDQESTTVIDGIRFRVAPAIRNALFPQKAGTLTIGEVSLGVRAASFMGPGRHLGTIRGDAIEVEVQPLPAKGQPAGFSPNNVGEYTIDAEIDRTNVAVGEPFTLTVSISGYGNIDVIDPGEWPEIDGVRRYEPKVETVYHPPSRPRAGGAKRYAFLMIPEQPGELELPSFSFSYFDPNAAEYRVAQTKPMVVTVSGTPSATASADPVETDEEPDSDPTVGDAGLLSGQELPLAPIMMGSTLPRVAKAKPWLTPSRWAWLALAIPALAGLGLGGAAALQRLGPDDAARERRAKQKQRQTLTDEAKRALESGVGFHAALGKLLQQVAVERTQGEGVGLPRPQLVALLQQNGVSEAERSRFVALLDACDAARFATAQGDVDERRRQFDDAMKLAKGWGGLS